MEALNHADQMRLANLINDNSDDAELRKKLDQVVELTSSTRDQAAVALHDCHYDVEKAVDMILEGDHTTVENQWKSTGKKKNKTVSSQSTKPGTHLGANSATVTGPNKSAGAPNKNHTSTSVPSNSGPQTSHSGSGGGATGSHMRDKDSHHHHLQQQQQQQSHHPTNKGNSQPSAAAQPALNSNINNSYVKQDAPDSLRNIAAVPSTSLISTSDSTVTSTTAVTSTKAPSLQQQAQTQTHTQSQQPLQQQQSHQQPRQRGIMHIGGRQQNQRSTKIPDSAVEMPNNELQVSSLNVQFGELDLREGSVGVSDSKGTFQNVLDSNRLSRQPGFQNSRSISAHDNKNSRQLSQQTSGGGPRRPYNNDERRFYNSSNRGGRQMSGPHRPYNQRQGQVGGPNNGNPRGVRTILNRGLQSEGGMTNRGPPQSSSGFPNSIDTWTNSTAEVASKTQRNKNQSIGVEGTLRVGQWSDVTGNEEWSEEEHWDAKVMETKVFTPSSKAADGPVTGPKNQSLLSDAQAPSQINLTSKLSEPTREDASSQANTLSTVTQPVQPQQSSQKKISHMNDIFDPLVAKPVLEKQNLASINPNNPIGIGQYNKETSDAKTLLDNQTLGTIKPKTTMSMNQYSREASESLKSLVGITSSTTSTSGAKGGVPSVPPGALPLMSQPQYIMGNAYQPAIFPYAYQTADVHYPVAAPNTGREQNFQSVYSPNEGNKFNRGADGDAPSIATTQTAPVASQTHNQAFVANALHAGYQLTYAMPGAFNMMPQNLYSAAPIFPHMPQPTNTGSANTVYQKNNPASYQHHTGYSTYEQLNLIQDYAKQQQNYTGSNMQQHQHQHQQHQHQHQHQQHQHQHQHQQHQHQQSTGKSTGNANELDVTATANSYNMYGFDPLSWPPTTRK